MTETHKTSTATTTDQPAATPTEARSRGWLSFVLSNKRWWLLPMLVVMSLVVGLGAFLSSGSQSAVYTRF